MDKYEDWIDIREDLKFEESLKLASDIFNLDMQKSFQQGKLWQKSKDLTALDQVRKIHPYDEAWQDAINCIELIING